ncbi:MAG: DUF3696 domain-containing protein [Desulfomonilaceae bacterium]
MINKFFVHGYKSLLEVELNPKKLNILVGANACGKSSILQTMLLLRQSAKGARDVSKLELSGELFEAGTTRDALNPEARASGINILIENEEFSSEATFSTKSTGQDYLRQLEATSALQLPNALVNETGDGFAYLSAERIGPRVVYPLPMPNSMLAGPIGMHGEFTTAFLARCQQSNTTPALDWYNLLTKAAEFMPEDLILDEGAKANLTRLDLVTNRIMAWLFPGAEFDATEHSVSDSAQLSYLRDPSGVRSPVRPTHMGFGLTFTLPVIAATVAMKQNGLLLIENPEAHLHPTSQSRIGSFLALAARDGAQSFIETHSDHVINGIRLAVKGKLINSEDVKFFYFRKRLRNDSTRVTNLSIFDDGRIDKWPEGFFDQIAKDLSRL